MATDVTAAASASQQRIDERLDAIDRSLLGVLPRTERLELVSKIESRIRELLAGGDAAIEAALETNVPDAAGREIATSTTPRRRSRAALSSGIIGLASVALMFAIPVVYILGSLLYEQLNLNETALIVLFGAIHLATFIAGSSAIVLGIAGLIKISRRQGKLFGSAWAVTGLCTGPLPVMAAGLPMLLMVLQMLLSSSVAVSVSATPPTPVGVTCSACSPAPMYSPAPVVSTYGAPGMAPAPYAAPGLMPAHYPDRPPVLPPSPQVATVPIGTPIAAPELPRAEAEKPAATEPGEAEPTPEKPAPVTAETPSEEPKEEPASAPAAQ